MKKLDHSEVIQLWMGSKAVPPEVLAERYEKLHAVRYTGRSTALGGNHWFQYIETSRQGGLYKHQWWIMEHSELIGIGDLCKHLRDSKDLSRGLLENHCIMSWRKSIFLHVIQWKIESVKSEILRQRLLNYTQSQKKRTVESCVSFWEECR